MWKYNRSSQRGWMNCGVTGLGIGSWLRYKACALQATEEVCGVSKGKACHGETWWWNEEVQEVIASKKASLSEGYKSIRQRKTRQPIRGIKRKRRKWLPKL